MLSILKESVKKVIAHPVVILLFFCMLAAQALVGFGFVKINEIIFDQSSIVHTIWFIIYTCVVLLIVSICTVCIIRCLLGTKHSLIQLSLKNILVILFTILIYNLTFFVSNYLAYFVGKSLALSTGAAKVLFFTIFFIGLISLLLFISFSSFFLVKTNQSVVASISKSASFVRSHYLDVLAVFVLFFVLLELSGFLQNISILFFSLTEIINYVIIYPLFAAVLATIINE
jgi:hypothetical protein